MTDTLEFRRKVIVTLLRDCDRPVEFGKLMDDAATLIMEYHSRSSKTLGPEELEHVAKAIWDWEHDNRESKILDIEWSLLRSEYLCRAQVAIAAYHRGKI